MTIALPNDGKRFHITATMVMPGTSADGQVAVIWSGDTQVEADAAMTEIAALINPRFIDPKIVDRGPQ